MPDISLLQREYDVAQEYSRAPSVAFTGSLIVLLCVVGAYVGLYAYAVFLEGDLKAITKRIEEVRVGDAYKNVEQLASLGNKIKTLKFLRESHTSVVKTIAKIEQSTLPDVYFASGNFNLETGVVALSGTAPSSVSFVRQMEVYGQDKNIAEFKLENPTYAEKHSVTISAKLTLRK